jgi:hypothetical protein
VSSQFFTEEVYSNDEISGVFFKISVPEEVKFGNIM